MTKRYWGAGTALIPQIIEIIKARAIDPTSIDFRIEDGYPVVEFLHRVSSRSVLREIGRAIAAKINRPVVPHGQFIWILADPDDEQFVHNQKDDLGEFQERGLAIWIIFP